MGKKWEMRDGRGDGDPDKEAKFYVLMNTFLPSVLVECGFMDTRADAETITSDKGQDNLALGIANGILGINGRKSIKKSSK
jgi:N-acetylmuramoyl-L-alanine amidase